MASSWRLVPGQALLHRGWDDAFVLYNDLSGDTHLLSGDAMALLVGLRDGDVTPEEMETFIAARGGMTQGWTGSFDKLEALLQTSPALAGRTRRGGGEERGRG